MSDQVTIKQDCILEKVEFESNVPFDCMVVRPGSIEMISWADKDYLEKLLSLDIYDMIHTTPENFMEVLATHLGANNYKIPNLSVKTEIIAEERVETNCSYVYQMLYFDLEKNPEFHKKENENEMAKLLSTDYEATTSIYSNAIIFKNKLMSLSDSMTLVSVTKENIINILKERINTKVVCYDMDMNYFKEDNILGDINNYAKKFFDEDYKKAEFGFLMHNINVWYTEAIYYPPRTMDRHDATIFEKLKNKKIDRCIWFTMKSDEYRGNLTLDEVNKIIYLSNKLETYITPKEYTDSKKDSMGRNIVYNKYKVLDSIYNKYL